MVSELNSIFRTQNTDKFTGINPMNIKTLKEIYLKELTQFYSRDEIQSFFYLLCETYLNKTRVEIALDPNFDIDPDHEAEFKKALEQLKLEYPIQYIIGQTEFMDLEFEVNQHVLIPRPETEELVRWVLSTIGHNKNYTILDIGTGSGCIPIVLAKHLPKSTIATMDISESALEVASRNACMHKVTVKFIKKNILTLDSLNNTYDVIVSNPPYVRESEKNQMQTNVLKYEPDLALYVSDQDPLLFYRHIAQLAINGLKPKGFLFFEINQYLAKDLCLLMTEIGFKNIELKKDIYGADRMIKAVKN